MKVTRVLYKITALYFLPDCYTNSMHKTAAGIKQRFSGKY